MNTVYDLEHEPSIFVYCFRFRGRSAFFLVSIDSCFHQDTQKKFGGAAVSGTGCMYNSFRGSDAGDLSERLTPVHEPSIFGNNFRLQGRR